MQRWEQELQVKPSSLSGRAYGAENLCYQGSESSQAEHEKERAGLRKKSIDFQSPLSL